MRRLRNCFLLSVICLFQEVQGKAIVLARDGKPAATIVIPSDAPARIGAGAKDLQEYIRKICGVELPITRDGRKVIGTGIYLGRCEPTQDADVPDKSLNPESYAIRVRDGSIFLVGRFPTPTYFAVVSFIENTLGVRWFAPGDDWVYVPSGKPGELTVEQQDLVKVPDTSPRMWSRHDFFEPWQKWCLRNKAVSGEVIPRRQFQNHLYSVFPPEKYAKTHPEYYPLVDGKRWIPEGDYKYWRPCESNPDVIRITVEAARKWFDKSPWSDSFSVGMDDIAHLCSCPNCRAMDAHPDSYEKREFSDRHYKFVNAVAREIAKTHPDKFIGTLIYAIARKPPETVPRLEDNVFGYITEVSARWCEPGRREADHELTREWAGRCKHLSRYDYFGLGTFTPRYYPHFMAEAIKFDKSLGMEGMYSELNTFLPHTAPMIWAFAKLEWDASLDIDQLLSEFMEKMFGAAAPTMTKYFDLLERSWNQPPPGRHDWEHRDIVIQALAISPQAVHEGVALLNAALKQADLDVIRRRIGVVRAGLQYAGYAIQAYSLSEEVLKTRMDNSAAADRVMGQVLQIMRLGAEREPFWDAARDRDDLLGENIRGLNQKGYIQTGKIGNLERGATVGGLRLMDWYASHAPERMPDVAAQLTGTKGSSIADLLHAWLWARESNAANLIVNGGFETAGSRPGEPDAPPTGWKTYSSGDRARFNIRSGAGRTGSTMEVTHAKSGSVLLQSHDVTAGQKCLCVAYAAGSSDQEAARGYLAVRFQTASGEWHPRRDMEPQVYMVSQQGWQPLALLVKVPEGAGRLVLMVGAKEQPMDSAVLFDDIAMYQLPD